MELVAVSPVARNPVTVVVVGRNRLMRVGIRRVLDAEQGLEMVGESATAKEAMDLVRQLNPGLLIIAGGLRAGDVTYLVRTVERLKSSPPVLVMSAEAERSSHDGNDDYISESASVMDFLAAVRKTLRQKPLSQLESEAPEPHSCKLDGFGLTVRETEVLEGLATGLMDKEISERLGISPRTVESHVRRLLLKLGVNNRTQAAYLALSGSAKAISKEDEGNRR